MKIFIYIFLIATNIISAIFMNRQGNVSVFMLNTFVSIYLTYNLIELILERRKQ